MSKIGAIARIIDFDIRCQLRHRRSISINAAAFAKDVPKQEKDMNVHDYGAPSTSRKRLYVFGLPGHGALGLPSVVRPSKTSFRQINRPIRHEIGDTRSVTLAAAGHGFSLVAVKPQEKHDNYMVYGTGLNTHSQIGYQAARVNAPLEVLIGFAPIQLPLTSKTKILAMGCGRAHSVISIPGGLLTFGDNSFGQCGRRIIDDEAYFGSKYIHKIETSGLGLEKNDDILKITSRFDVTYCLTKSGNIVSFGSNTKGQLGRGRTVLKQWEPVAIAGGDLSNEKVTAVSTSGTSTMAATEKGDVFVWGCNETGNIDPFNKAQVIYEPRHVKFSPKIGKVVDVAVGELCSFIVNEKGDVYTWGHGNLMGLGPDNTSIQTPTLMPPPLFGRNEFNPDCRVKRVVCSYFYAAAITTQGSLYSWGKNVSGCLGLGPLDDQFFPFKVGLGGQVVDVFLGVDHTLVISAGGL